jgi:hypothetical protein
MPTVSRKWVVAAAILLSLVLAGGVATAHGKRQRPRATVFAPYIDMTLYPPPDLLAIHRASGVRQVSLDFVVAQPGAACAPTWGGYPNDPATGPSAFRLANVEQFTRAGGSVVPSFGGQAGTELAATCATAATLAHAYDGVIAAYRPRRIDFDIEGTAVDDKAAISKRSAAIAALEREHRKLQVSFTLPVNPTGLDPDAVAVLRSAISNHVKITFVNVMTMDYGDDAAPNPQGRMGSYATQAAGSVARQLHKLYPHLSAARRMRMVGITPMIGINDVSDEVFTLTDAQQVKAFAKRGHVGMLGMWELSRDHQCPHAATTTQLTCSGVAQSDYAFARAL